MLYYLITLYIILFLPEVGQYSSKAIVLYYSKKRDNRPIQYLEAENMFLIIESTALNKSYNLKIKSKGTIRS